MTSAADGVWFQLDPSRPRERIAWTVARGESTNGWLALPDENGEIKTGKQLFGNFAGESNGFLQLAIHDQSKNGGNGDGVIDWRDSVYGQLRVWKDKNHDGVAQPDELYTLPAEVIYSIGPAYTESTFTIGKSTFRYKATINVAGNPPGDHVDRVIYDVFLESLGSRQDCNNAGALVKREWSSDLLRDLLR